MTTTDAMLPPGWFIVGVSEGAAPHLAHDFEKQSVACYAHCRRCRENAVAAGESKGVGSGRKTGRMKKTSFVPCLGLRDILSRSQGKVAGQ